MRSTAGVLLDSIDFGHGARPHDVVFNASGTFAYVSLKGGGKIVRINPSISPLQVDAELDAGDTVTAIAVNSSTDELLLNRFISPDTAGEIHLYKNVGGAIGFAQTIALAVDTTSVEDGESARGLPNYLADVAIDPFGEFAYVTAKQDNILRGGFKDGQPLTHETSVRAIVSKIDLASNTEVDRLDIDNSSQPSALAFSPLGDYLFIALQGNNHIRVRDSFSGSLIATLETGLAPQGMCFDSSSNRLFVKNLTAEFYDSARAERKRFDESAVGLVSFRQLRQRQLTCH